MGIMLGAGKSNRWKLPNREKKLQNSPLKSQRPKTMMCVVSCPKKYPHNAGECNAKKPATNKPMMSHHSFFTVQPTPPPSSLRQL